MNTRIRLHPMGDQAGGGGGGGGVFPGVVQTAKPPNSAPPTETKPKIVHIGEGLGSAGRHQDTWKRKANPTGTGATHVKSFHCRMNEESLALMDNQINHWLDDHPEYDVKAVTTSVGEWQGKIKEPNLIVTVWV